MTLKRLPCPGVLSTATLPPWASASRSTSASPSPVPVYWRLRLLSICTKGWKSFARCSAAMPMPVSHTVNVTVCCSTSPVTSSPTRPPLGVNLTALESRLTRICLSRRSSAWIVSIVLSSVELMLTRCISASCVTMRRLVWQIRPTSIRAISSSSRPASIFERSRISLIRVSRCRPLSSMPRSDSPCFGVTGP